MENLNLSKKETQNLLKDLRLYSSLRKDLGHKGKQIFEKIKNNKSRFFVEYFPNIDLDFVLEKSNFVYKNYFSVSPSKEDIDFIAKESLFGGIKIYMDDRFVDLSFEKIDKNLRKV